jgi:hypothetical protein
MQICPSIAAFTSEPSLLFLGDKKKIMLTYDSSFELFNHQRKYDTSI